MSWDTEQPKSGSYEAPPAGMHPAVLVAIVDLGTHTETFRDKGDQSERVSDSRKLFFVWELVGVLKSGSKEPHLVGERFTLSLGKKAKLRQLIEAWRGRALGDGERFDPAVLLGKPCNLNLQEKPGGYVNYANASPPMKGQQIGKPYWALFKYHIDGDPSTIPDWVPYCYGTDVRDLIRDSKEKRAAAGEAHAHAGGGAEGETEFAF